MGPPLPPLQPFRKAILSEFFLNFA
ncbi:MAG: hypothetical protein IK008_04655 [Bacteroidales bacterium]|nr:hypothetical protein [Bacteroidales bacterium]